MKFIRLYASKILSLRQKIILFGAVTCCVFATAGTYLVVEYFSHAMELSVADKQPHVRFFCGKNGDAEAMRVRDELRSHPKVARCDIGWFFGGDFYITSRRLPDSFEDERGEIYFEGVRKTDITAYPFDSRDYEIPIFLENVYSQANKNAMREHPEDAPVAIITDPQEDRFNYGIVNKSLTKIFPFGASTFANRFEIFGKDSSGELDEVPMLTAGYFMDSPLSVGGETFKIFTRRKVLSRIVPQEQWETVVDCSLNDRDFAGTLKQEVTAKYPAIKAETWEETNPQAKPFLSGLRTMSYLGVCAILAVSVLGVALLIFMLVLEKSRQLAILYALGMDAVQLRSIFLLIGLRIGVFSCLAGIISAFLTVRFFLPRLTEIVRLFCQIQEEKLVFSWADTCVFCLSVIVFCAIASWLPTRRITQSDPAKYLRSE